MVKHVKSVYACISMLGAALAVLSNPADAFTTYRDSDGKWQAPINPATEWLRYLNPREFRFDL